MEDRIHMKISDRISKAPLFNGLPAEQIEKLAQICLDQKFEKGRELFSEGNEAKGFYLVLGGKIKIYKLSLEGKEQILHIFGSGEIFGEVPVFAGGNYPASAAAIEQSRALFFPRISFIELVSSEPAIALNLLGILSKRLRRFTLLIEDLSLKEVPGRLAAYLIYLGQKSPGLQTLELEINRTQLASLLGTIPETVSRILAKMARQAVISVEGRKIRVLDRKALESLAAGGKGAI
ncbi:MAG TPA: Crp/Fnr family transcriptional regulator [Syntrophobacteraceae bacterium]|nr:Crp/Fnr family transcriptional regulator [Syntrophobacteraceae bacterium]